MIRVRANQIFNQVMLGLIIAWVAWHVLATLTGCTTYRSNVGKFQPSETVVGVYTDQGFVPLKSSQDPAYFNNVKTYTNDAHAERDQVPNDQPAWSPCSTDNECYDASGENPTCN